MELTGKRVLVYGAGKSGKGAASLLEKMGAEPFFYEDSYGEIDFSERIDLAVLSPGVPTDAPHVCAIRERGIPIWGEVELAYRAGRGKVFAITGTNGKTTTTSLVGELLKAYYDEVYVVGNIGTAWTTVADQTTENAKIAAEISSFQLETVEQFHPAVSAILNITEDHLNRHHTMEEYIRVKELITKNQTKDDVCVLNYEDEALRAFADVCPARVVFFSSATDLAEGFCLRGDRIVLKENGEERLLAHTEELRIIGTHNYENAMAGAAMAYAAGVPFEVISAGVKAFRAVEHRIEYAGTKRGVVWYNDSKGTNPDAAIKGIQAMKWPTLLIGGGYDKGSDYHEWIRSFDGKVRWFVLEGKTKEDIRKAALECGFPEDRIVLRENMTEAMEFCLDHARPGDAVLLSPACASWGEFENYEVRGRMFKEFVAGITE